MTFDDLEIVHLKMLEGIHAVGGRIDKIYYCPHLESDDCSCRKPRPGMALQAQNDFPEIDFTKSIMVGDGIHDIIFGHKLGMKTVFITSETISDPLADFQLNSLAEFAIIIA